MSRRDREALNLRNKRRAESVAMSEARSRAALAMNAKMTAHREKNPPVGGRYMMPEDYEVISNVACEALKETNSK